MTGPSAPYSAHDPERARDCCTRGRESRNQRDSTALLPPQAHRFLPRQVGEREQHRFAARANLERMPGGDDEGVARAESELLLADLHLALALDHGIDGAVGRAAGTAREPGGQQLD